MALSFDGNRALIGGENDNIGAGAAWMFVRSGTAWTQQGAKLVGTGANGAAHQGWSVAVSGDGNTALIGGHNDNGGAGAAWVFTRSGTTWTQQGAKLVGTGATGAAQQGYSVAVSGNTALVGGPEDNGGAGAAWVFVRSGGAWTQYGAKLVGTGATGAAQQGSSVAVSSDGHTALIGAPGDSGRRGAAWVFVLWPATLRITRLRATPLRRGCETETGPDERESTAQVAAATCRHLSLTLAGTIQSAGKVAPAATGTIRVTVRVKLPRGPATRTARGAAHHGHWKIAVILPALNLDPTPPSYLITVRYGGNSTTQSATTTRRIRLESERAG